MNWPYILTCAIYGSLWGLWSVASAILVLGGWPDPFGWLKLWAVGTVSFVGGIFTFIKSPGAAWGQPPGGKAP